MLERGVYGIVLEAASPAALREMAAAGMAVDEKVPLVSARVTEIANLGIGDRVCVDTCSLIEGVITSYSIHYTKLYDRHRALFRRSRRGRAGGGQRGLRKDAGRRAAGTVPVPEAGQAGGEDHRGDGRPQGPLPARPPRNNFV